MALPLPRPTDEQMRNFFETVPPEHCFSLRSSWEASEVFWTETRYRTQADAEAAAVKLSARHCGEIQIWLTDAKGRPSDRVSIAEHGKITHGDPIHIHGESCLSTVNSALTAQCPVQAMCLICDRVRDLDLHGLANAGYRETDLRGLRLRCEECGSRQFEIIPSGPAYAA